MLCVLISEFRRRLELLKSEHGDWFHLPFHAHVRVMQEQTAAHIKAERFLEANACLSLLSFLTSYLATDDSAYVDKAGPESGMWAAGLLEMSKAGQPSVVKRLLAYVQRLTPNPALWTELMKDLLTCSGSVNNKRYDRQQMFQSVNAKTTTAFASAVCVAIHHEMDQCEWLLAQTKVINMYTPPDRGVAAEDEEKKEPNVDRPTLILRARQQYNEQCWQQLLHVADVVHHIARVAFVKSELERVGATLTRTFKLVTLATSQVYAAGRNPSKPFNALMDFTVTTLCPSTDQWQRYVTIGMQRVREEGAAEMRNEARMLPELQKAFSACEAAIIRLSRADFCRHDYTKQMQRYKSRDFQLNPSRTSRRDSGSDSESEQGSNDSEDDDNGSREDSDSQDEDDRDSRRKTKQKKQQKSRVSKQSQRSQKLHTPQKRKKRRAAVRRAAWRRATRTRRTGQTRPTRSRSRQNSTQSDKH